MKWYVYASGNPGKGGGTIDVRNSVDDGRTWTYLGTVWHTIPSWLTDIVPGANNMWAPEIIEHGGTYYLYYAVSTLGHNDSVIALATNTTLDPKAPAYSWVDQGKVVRSLPASDFNAIDPGRRPGRRGHALAGVRLLLEWDPDGAAAVAFRQALRRPTRTTCSTARSRSMPSRPPSIVSHGGWYYLLTLVGPVLRGREEHLPHRRRAVQDRSPAPTSTATAAPSWTAAAPRCWRR